MASVSPAPPRVAIRPTSGWVPLRLGELWQYRELFYFLVWRDIKVRYKQTALGGAWAIIQPFFTMVVFSIFFGALAGIPSEGVPYPVFTFAALVPWTFFSTALSQAGNSLVQQERVIAKVYFPRLIVPSAAVLAGLVDLAIAFAFLLGMMAVYGMAPSLVMLLIPAFVLLAALTALAAGLWLSALNVKYRDVRYTLIFLVQVWLFATPIAYPSSLVPERWQTVYGLNPMVGVVEGFRWAVFGHVRPPAATLAVSMGVVAVLLVGGLYYFRRMERSFADVI